MTYAENAAKELRRRWMAERGCSQKEIDRMDDYPADLDDEIKNVRAQVLLDATQEQRDAQLNHYFPLELDLSNL